MCAIGAVYRKLSARRQKGKDVPNKITLPALPLSGGCQCGAVRYLVHAAPEVFYICHCTECQKQSASAFGQSLRVKSTAVTITGEMASFVRGSASGNDVACDFCPQCGSRLFHHRAQYAETMNVKAGTLDDTRWLKPAGHIWT
ncbi:MAG: GFA family protein, partial [Hyphomicrobiaceae bacterium]|nr:GFA family protein [Hyphomicrobiaceae bacterium]